MKQPIAHVRIGRYDVDEPTSNKPCITMQNLNDGEDIIIVTEDDPNARPFEGQITFIDPWVDDTFLSLLLSAGMAETAGVEHIDPNKNGGFKAKAVKVIAEDGYYTIYDDFSYEEDESWCDEEGW